MSRDWFKELEDMAEIIKSARSGTLSEEDKKRYTSSPLTQNSSMPSREKTGYLQMASTENTNTGWKFHLSIDPSQIKKAWNLIAEDIVKLGIDAKVLVPDRHNSASVDANSAWGKSIVLYAADGKDITPLLKKIEAKLQDAGIKPGTPITGDKPLKGSSYIAYRNDLDNNGAYVSSSKIERLPEDKRYNPFEKPDPFKDLDVRPTVKPNAPEAVRPNTPKVDAATLYVAQMTIAGAEYQETINKGNRLKSNDPDNLRAALQVQGFKPGIHFNETKSSTGQTVFQLLPDGDTAFKEIRTDFQAGKPPVIVGATPAATPVATPAAEPVKPVPQQPAKPAVAPVAVDIDLGQPVKAPPKTPEQHMAAAGERFRQDVNPSVKPIEAAAAQPPKALPPQPARPAAVDIDLSGNTPERTSSGIRPTLSATGQRLDGRTDKAQTAIIAGAQAVQGDIAGAAVTVGTAAAQQVGIGKAAQLAEKAAEKTVPVVMSIVEKLGVGGAAKAGGKLLPGIGGWLNAAEALTNVTSAIRQGQYIKAGAEALTGVITTGMGTVGLGSLAEGVRHGIHAGIKYTAGEKYAPEGSQIIGVVISSGSAIVDAGKTALGKQSADFIKLSRSDLAAAIQKDPTMVDTVPFKGNHVNLATALEDKEFRTKFLKQLEAEAKGGANRTTQIAMIKAYEAKIETGQPAATAPVAQAIRPATVAIPSSQAQAQTAVLNAQYKSMSTTQLADAILKDPVLPDTVAINGKTVSIKEAIKDGTFRDKLIANLEAAQAKGTDLSQQIAMLKAYDNKMDAAGQSTVAPTQVAQAQRPAQSPPPSISAPMA